VLAQVLDIEVGIEVNYKSDSYLRIKLADPLIFVEPK